MNAAPPNTTTYLLFKEPLLLPGLQQRRQPLQTGQVRHGIRQFLQTGQQPPQLGIVQDLRRDARAGGAGNRGHGCRLWLLLPREDASGQPLARLGLSIANFSVN